MHRHGDDVDELGSFDSTRPDLSPLTEEEQAVVGESMAH